MADLPLIHMTTNLWMNTSLDVLHKTINPQQPRHGQESTQPSSESDADQARAALEAPSQQVPDLGRGLAINIVAGTTADGNVVSPKHISVREIELRNELRRKMSPQ